MSQAHSDIADTPLFTAASVPELLQALADKEHIIAEQQKLIRLMEEQLRLAQLRRFGSRSEKLPYIGDLFDEVELEVVHDEAQRQLPPPSAAEKPRKKRAGFSDRLERVRIELPLTDEQKAGASKTLFTKVKEELDIVPAQARLLEGIIGDRPRFMLYRIKEQNNLTACTFW